MQKNNFNFNSKTVRYIVFHVVDNNQYFVEISSCS